MSPEAADAALWKEYAETRSEGCRERIVKRYLPLIKYVVGRMVVTPPSGLDYEDLLSFGIFGLLDAIERFDLSKGFSFQTFAVPRIRGAVLDELRKCDWFSRTGREKVQRLNRAMERVLRDRGALRDDWVMQEMGVDERTYLEAQELASRSYIASLDEVSVLEDGEVSIEATLADDREGAQERLEAESDREQLVTAMKQLTEREQQVLSLYYYEGLALKEIGRVLGVTESRVSQIHGHALSALRATLQGAELQGVVRRS